jgi:hypothetical protein
MTTVELDAEQHVRRLEADIEVFARHLTEAQEAGVSHAIILPRMMLAFRRSFGDVPLPGGLTLPQLPPS